MPFLAVYKAILGGSRVFSRTLEFKTILRRRIITMTQQEKDQIYDRYLNTMYWKSLSASVITSRGARCQTCASNTRLNVHHNTYENITFESDHDLFVMCKECHQHFHNTRKLSGMQLHQIDFEFLKRFVDEQEQTDPHRIWYPAFTWNHIIEPTRHKTKSASVYALTVKEFDDLAATFNCMKKDARKNYFDGIYSFDNFVKKFIIK